MRVLVVTFDEQAGDEETLKWHGVAMADYLRSEAISFVVCSSPGTVHLAKLIGHSRLQHAYVSVRTRHDAHRFPPAYTNPG
jgi:hypothetical protein